MIYSIGSFDDACKYTKVLNVDVFNDICLNIAHLKEHYGKNFDYTKIGGYSVVVENADDLMEFKDIIDYESHLCEWADSLPDGMYVSALFVVNNDLSVRLYVPKAIAPKSVLDSLVF